MADESFKDYVLDQLSALPKVRARAMFGGHGLYEGDRFFGILSEGRLYFKTDAQSETDYLEHGMSPFTYEQHGRKLTMRYYEVPPEVLEDRGELAAWASRAIESTSASSSKSIKVRKSPRSRQRK